MADLPPPSDELARLVARTAGLQPWRRAVHAASGLLVAFAPPLLGLGRGATVAVLGCAAAVLFAADIARLRSQRLNVWFFRVFGTLASPREEGHLASSTWFALGAFLAWALWPPHVATASLSVLALADPAASMVGRLAGRHRLGKGTVQGSSAFALTAFIVLVPQVGLAAAVTGAVATTLFEVLPLPFDDNLTVPMACGAALWVFGWSAA